MAETKVVEPTFKFDETKFKDKLKSLEKSKDEQAGREGYNPFLFWVKNVKPALEEFEKGVRTKELFDKFMALPNEIPKL